MKSDFSYDKSRQKSFNQSESLKFMRCHEMLYQPCNNLPYLLINLEA